MPRGSYRPPDGYLTLSEAQQRLAIGKHTLQRMVRAGKLATFADPRNARVTLVNADDVERLMQPIPLGKAAS